MSTALSIIGILLVMLGTLLSLWNIFSTKSSDVGTAIHHDTMQDQFKKQKKWVAVGFVLIVIGSILQIIGLIA